MSQSHLCYRYTIPQRVELYGVGGGMSSNLQAGDHEEACRKHVGHSLQKPCDCNNIRSPGAPQRRQFASELRRARNPVSSSRKGLATLRRAHHAGPKTWQPRRFDT